MFTLSKKKKNTPVFSDPTKRIDGATPYNITAGVSRVFRCNIYTSKN